MSITVAGQVAPGWEGVRDAFAANFARPRADLEVGASLAVYRDGACVVDLWGGHADLAQTRPWNRDTLANIWSATKGVMSIAAAMLVGQGRLSYDDKVARHWPEFAAAGKQDITVGQILSHQSGVNGWELPITLPEMYDWPTATSRLAAQAPFWPPGSGASYHAITHGFLIGEVIRRITGQSPGAFVRDHLAGPLGADLFIGLPAAEDGRACEMIAPLEAPAAPPAPNPIAARATGNPKFDQTAPNDRAWRAAEIPAANGQAGAQGLARIYGAVANGGVLDGKRILDPAAIEGLRAPRFQGADMMLGPRTWGAGVAWNVVPSWGPHAETFGHSGWGGAYGCAHLPTRIGIGYVMNHMSGSIVGNPRGASLAAAIFEVAARVG